MEILMRDLVEELAGRQAEWVGEQTVAPWKPFIYCGRKGFVSTADRQSNCICFVGSYVGENKNHIENGLRRLLYLENWATEIRAVHMHH